MKFNKEEASEDKSTFNMGVAMLYRIDAILTSCATNSARMNLSGWGHSLFALCKEFNYMFSEEETDVNQNFQDKINPLLTEFEEKMTLKDEYDPTYYLKQGAEFPNYGLLNRLLIDYEKFLRFGLYKRDMLVVRKPDLQRVIEDL